ncbi:MAG: hypothetical protein E4H36_15875, partial [Spirochaetales bacterium]
MVNLPFKNRPSSLYHINPTKIIALGLNYRDHIAESASMKGLPASGVPEEPEEPILFPKLPSAVIGPDDTIVIPAYLREYNFKDPRCDYEAELAFIIRDRCRKVPESEAYDHILGYLCLNDVSQRNFQKLDKS